VRRLPPLPAVPPPFDAGFRAALHEVLAHGRRARGQRSEPQRARAAALSQSGTFVGHRRYSRGDDLRRIDWAAYARSGELFVKLFEEEERRAATLLLDLSPSLLVGEPPRRFHGWRLAAVVGGLALRALDGLAVVAPGAGASAVAHFAGAGDLDRLLLHLQGLPVAASAPRDAVELVLQRPVPGRVHWVGDFVDLPACELLLAALRRRGGSAVGWLPAIAEDHGAVRPGYVSLADPETGQVQAVAPDAGLAAELRRQLDALQRAQDRVFAQCGAALVRWPAPPGTGARAADYREIVALCSR